MKRIVVRLIVTAVVLSVLIVGWASKHQQVVPQTCPFDPNLSVGLAFKGAHFYFHTSEIQDTILNARFAWFQPDEAPNPILFNSRIAQEPPEEDWVWWETRFPTALLVQVSDSSNRLGKVEVWNLDREILDGVLEATPDGSTVNGTIILNEFASFRLVNIKDRNDKVLARLLTQNPKVVLQAVIIYAYWVPHPPPLAGADVREIKEREEIHSHPVEVWSGKTGELRTENWNCTVKYFQVECHPGFSIKKEQHIADKGTEVRVLTPPPQGCCILDTRTKGCGAWVEILQGKPPLVPLQMTQRYKNDSDKPDIVSPPHMHYLREVVDKMAIDSRTLERLTETARRLVDKEVFDFQKEKEVRSVVVNGKKIEIVLDDSLALAPAEVKPYSESCIHWTFYAHGEIRAVYIFPDIIGEKPEFGLIRTLLTWIGFRINQSKHPMTFFLFEGFKKVWEDYISQREEIRKAKINPKDLMFYGDVWVVYVTPGTSDFSPAKPRILFERNLTQDVKVQIVRVNPDGTEEAIDGSVGIECLEPLTTPPPPPPPPFTQGVEVSKEGTNVALGKGWSWKISTAPFGQQVSVVIKVPPTTSVTIKVPTPQPPGGQPPGGQPPGGQPPPEG